MRVGWNATRRRAFPCRIHRRKADASLSGSSPRQHPRPRLPRLHNPESDRRPGGLHRRRVRSMRVHRTPSCSRCEGNDGQFPVQNRCNLRYLEDLSHRRARILSGSGRPCAAPTAARLAPDPQAHQADPAATEPTGPSRAPGLFPIRRRPPRRQTPGSHCRSTLRQPRVPRRSTSVRTRGEAGFLTRSAKPRPRLAITKAAA